MKKQVTKKIFALMILGLFLLSISLSFVSAGPFGDSLTWDNVLEKIKPFVVPSGMEGWEGALVGIIALLIVFAIMVDIVMLVAPFSSKVNWIISIGLGIIMVVFKWNVHIAGWIVGIGASIFGFAGAAAAGLTIIMAILALVFIFFGGQKLQGWISGIRGRRQILEAKNEAYKKASEIVKGGKTMEEVGKGM